VVTAAGETGCGWEATLESMYRFLAHPIPYASLELLPCYDGDPSPGCATHVGVDQTLLAQRAAFLRPDSSVGVLLFSDENDCSILDSGQAHIVADLVQTMPRATSACDADPNSPCCTSCAAATPNGCDPDPVCTSMRELDRSEDSANLRCFNQKRRFGVDFLQPIERYVNALSAPELCLQRSDLDADECAADCRANAECYQENPLFRAPASGQPRGAGAVVVAAAVGVPWQDIARDPAASELAFMSASELLAAGRWAVIHGGDSGPSDPFMVESVEPRTGSNPVVDANIELPTAMTPLANPINGHEYSNADLNDLQHACIFPLAEPRDCNTLGDLGCECRIESEAYQDKAVCQDPTTGIASAVQHFDRAYPGLRHLGVISGLGERGVLSSICSREAADTASANYAYAPVLRALGEGLERVLAP
jgi:hypothetical protein